MSVRPVRIYGDPILRQRAADVTTFDESLRGLVADMHDTMQAYRGVGLAANQIGVAQRVFVLEVPGDAEGDPPHRYDVINPVILSRSGSESAEEGCLSIPGVYEDISRALRLTLEYADVTGKRSRLEANGYLARAIQHELDHLDGVLFVDRMSPLRRSFLRRPLAALARGEMPEDYRPPVSAGGGR